VDIKHLAQQAGALAVMEYGFLYDKARHLLAIGFNVDERRLDPSYYDLLASEARLSTFVAIAQGQLPQESWFALGRLLTTAAGKPTLLSWSGSMFEYLMPNLVMPTYENSLLDQTCKAAVARQIAYAKQRGVPWGISECGYNAVDAAHNYQYRAFGVPGLGLKRGLSEDLVITPYASALALMIMPEAACLNLQRLAADGLAGQFGFYEAIDYTASRLPSGKTSVLIRSFMAHHQGMIFLSLAYLLLDRPMQKRFESEPMLQATTLLLQERAPRAGVFQQHNDEFPATPVTASGSAIPILVFGTPNTQLPEVQLLSNGRYHVMLTNAGGGYSRWKDLALTRWREDTTCDNWGTFCYIRDLASGVFWSNTHQPTLKHADTCETIFSEGRAEFRRHDLDYDTYTEIVVSPEDDIELRRVRISNRARTRRTIEITSYAEVVLAAPAAEALHPAFSNLFVQTEIIRERNTILCTRRPRSLSEQSPWMFHLMTLHGAATGEISYETDRLRFIGRGHTVASPHAMIHSAPLSGSSGSVLDPVVAIRYRITLEPEQTVMIDLVSGISTTRDAALLLAGKYQDRQLADRVFDLAWTNGQIVLRQINGSEVDAQLYARLAGSIIYANSGLRADAGVLKRNKRGQSGLWGYAISGDLPIVLLQIGDSGNIDLVRQLVQAHAYWRLKGLSVDLVIWNEDRAGYRQSLQEQIMGLIAAGLEAHVINRPGGIFVRPAEQISDEDRVLVQSVARAIISDRRGTLGEQLDRVHLSAGRAPHLKTPPFKASRARRTEPAVTAAVARDDLLLFNNGLGGFSPDGREYVITTSQGHTTPLPWVNVLANAHFGTVVSESGAAYTWCENAHEFRLTPWCNDPVSDPGGETFYLRDEESGHFWSPTPLPSGGTGPYVSRHGFGYSCFEHTEEGISSELTVFVALDAAVKFSILKVRNGSGHSRRLSATGYVEWVMGDQRPKSAMHVITEIDPLSGAFYARNAYNTEFADRIAFFDVDDKIRTVSGDRAEFIGRNGTLANPVAMSRAQLSNKVGAALDPCAAIQVAMELADGEERVFTFRLGVAGRRGADESNQLVQRFRGSTVASDALKAVRQYWVTTLGGVQVETPDKSLNLLTNGWLLYQTLACRLWGRSGYYQSGGAFGFRDQLQDAMALVYAEPALVREHLLRCAARQFVEGDVQHWWQPTSGRGVRTHCSDDFLWLPLAMCRYVASTGDTGVLDEPIAFIEGRAIKPGEDSYYDLPGRSAETASLYQHGIRAILRGLRFGEHGLPLIGSGDWNDGMNTVGNEGKGESVWLAFFLYDVLMQFARLAAVHNDASFAERCQKEAAQLRLNIDRNGWDGEWYLRAYFDDGTPLGSADDAECQIDAVAQSWAVLSGAGDPVRARTAMAAVDHRLVRRDHALIQLLDPPFDKSMSNPGYIKGYVPGVRENGGQYTHAAIWTVMAFAALGDRRRAWELFDMINPVNHANSEAAIAVYKVEPYVVAADVYAVVPHIGRGGWTWYTGSAGWMYRLILESLLGLKLEADKLRFEPCLPESWETFKLQYRYCETDYHITVFQTHATNKKACVIVDGAEQADDAIALVNDRLAHEVEVHTYRTSG
jgi:cellobiose phosphorylase